MEYKWNTDKELDALWDEIESIEDFEERERQSTILSKLEAERWADEILKIA